MRNAINYIFKLEKNKLNVLSSKLTKMILNNMKTEAFSELTERC